MSDDHLHCDDDHCREAWDIARCPYARREPGRDAEHYFDNYDNDQEDDDDA